MKRTTYDFGIDLGTTNSAIAELKNTTVEVYRNNEGFEFTSSTVWMDKNNRIHVGRRAKERLESDPENAFSEFKLQMGSDAEYQFARSGKKVTPEDLSAEVLKSLKADVMQRTGEDINAAVITVPAAFELPQCNATQKAAELAGFSDCTLLQEPVAAAMAYSFQEQEEKAFWLVYDFGGGTFDAAIIQVQDSTIQVVNHNGDNHLGGKLIDWAIVDDLLVPELLNNYSLKGFRRGNPKWASAFAKLKQAAENAKIQVSRAETAEIIIDYLCQDDQGKPIQFEFEVNRKDVEKLALPFLVRSINISKKVLAEKRLAPKDIEKVLLVGGTTLLSSLRELLLDPEKGFGITLESSIDPLTVVARGAAIFSATQRIETKPDRESIPHGQYIAELDYKPVGADQDPLIGGKVSGQNGTSMNGFTIEFVNSEAKPEWRSGKITLNDDGSFLTNLWAEKGQKNNFSIFLYDTTGTIQKVTPGEISYTIGVTLNDPPLIHSIGVSLANNETAFYFEKGIPLPARKRKMHRIAFEVSQGQEGALVKIPVVEGENQCRSDRNRLIGSLEINAENIQRTLPAGSEVEVTIEIDKSRLIQTRAYIPILDEEFGEVLKLGKEAADPEALASSFAREKKRLEKNQEKAGEFEGNSAQQLLNRIEEENMLHEIESALSAAPEDRDAADKCNNRLLDLKATIDDIEDALEWPGLVAETEETIELAERVIEEYGDDDDKKALKTLTEEIQQAVKSNDAELLQRKINALDGLRIQVARTQPGYWVGLFEAVEAMQDSMTNSTLAQQYITQGNRAIDNNDIDGLKSATENMISLLPVEEQRGFGGSIL